jgi:hypothetical protein
VTNIWTEIFLVELFHPPPPVVFPAAGGVGGGI